MNNIHSDQQDISDFIKCLHKSLELMERKQSGVELNGYDVDASNGR